MAEKKVINTVIVLRNDQTTAWESSDHVLLKGEVGIGYLENGNVIAKLGDNEHTWADLPQIEGVFEDDITLTHNFGRHKTSNGFVKTDAKGMTTSQWLIDALSEVLNPTINYPSVSLTGGAYIEGDSTTSTKCEIGSYITALRWDGTFNAGSYKDAANSGTYGTTTEKSNKTGLGASNVSWTVSNSVDTQTKPTEDGKFDLTSEKRLQVDSETSKSYAEVSAVAVLNASTARVPLNNVGDAYEAGKITGFDKNGTTTQSLTASCSVTGYRKPFYGVLAPADVIDINNLTSDIIRGLPKSGTETKGLPSSIEVPAGSQMVIFAAKAGTYNDLTTKDENAMGATVTFDKKANAVRVKGANNFVTSKTGDAANGELYDVWCVNWGAGIGSAKQLTLNWA